MQYPLCNQTVTLYRKTGEGVLRQVIPNCFYRWELLRQETDRGIWDDTRCLLVIPGDDPIPRVDDRIFQGVGPENVDWETFLPVNVPGLSQLNYVAPQYWQGKHCHTEAGRK